MDRKILLLFFLLLRGFRPWRGIAVIVVVEWFDVRGTVLCNAQGSSDAFLLCSRRLRFRLTRHEWPALSHSVTELALNQATACLWKTLSAAWPRVRDGCIYIYKHTRHEQPSQFWRRAGTTPDHSASVHNRRLYCLRDDSVIEWHGVCAGCVNFRGTTKMVHIYIYGKRDEKGYPWLPVYENGTIDSATKMAPQTQWISSKFLITPTFLWWLQQKKWSKKKKKKIARLPSKWREKSIKNPVPRLVPMTVFLRHLTAASVGRHRLSNWWF